MKGTGNKGKYRLAGLSAIKQKLTRRLITGIQLVQIVK
jgi:hypothetical protein